MKSSGPGVRPVEVLEQQHDRRRRPRGARRRCATPRTAPARRRRALRRRRAARAARLDPPRSARRGRAPRRVSAMRARVVASSSVSSRPARDRTISPSAQNVIPSPYDGERPWCHQTASTTPSTYLRNSHARRLLPMPACPMIDTRRTRRSREVAWNRSLSRRSSSSRPTNGASRRSSRPRPPRSATTRSARHAGTGAALPLSRCSPAASYAIAPGRRALGRLADEHRAGRGADWSRDAVLTRSPATMPWPRRRGSRRPRPVSTPARAWRPRSERPDRVDELQAGADRALGVVLVGRRARPRRP